MTPEDRKKLAERFRTWADWASQDGEKDNARDFAAAADLIDPPQPAGTERIVVQVFRDGRVLFADGFSDDDDDDRVRRAQKMVRDGATLAATIVADIPLPPEPPVVEGTVVQ